MNPASAMRWKEIPLEQYCDSVRDGTHDSPKFLDTGFPLITSKSIKMGRIILDTANLISEQDFNDINRRSKVDQWDVLFSMIGTVGEVCLVYDEEPSFAIKNIGLFKSGNELNGKWLYYWLTNPVTKAGIKQALRGASQQYIPLGELRKIPVRVPVNRDVMNQVVGVIASYDDLIENNRRRMALLEESARLLYREWFIRLRFPGYEHTPVVDGVPRGWERKTLGEVTYINQRSIGNSFDGEIEYIDIASVTRNSVNEATQYAFRDAPGRARRLVRHGDIIWSCVRPNRRSHAVIWQPAENLITSTGFVVISPKSLPTSFLYQSVTTDLFVGYLENHAKGAAYPAVVSGDFERAIILTPSPALATTFNDFAEPLLNQAHNLRLQNQKLRAARDLLLPRLMSGELAA